MNVHPLSLLAAMWLPKGNNFCLPFIHICILYKWHSVLHRWGFASQNVYGPAESALPGACEKSLRLHPDLLNQNLPLNKILQVILTYGHVQVLAYRIEWGGEHLIGDPGIYLRQSIIPDEVLSSKRTQPTVKGVQTLQPFLLACELCRTWWPVSTYLPPTPSTFKETTTWTWNRTGCAKGLRTFR